MNTPSNTLPESHAGSPSTALALSARIRPLYWSVRREVWENRSIYLAPLAAATFFLLTVLVHTVVLRVRHHGVWPANPNELFDTPYLIAAGLIMATAFFVGIFYSLDALYGERRDRSILFWKSLPVSDVTTVLSKLIIPLFFLPLISFLITVVTQWLMLLLSTVLLVGSGLNIPALWAHPSFSHFSLVLLYHIVTVHGLWYAPIYCWLLLVSAWAPRAPFLWAFLPPFVICGVEKIAFNTQHVLAMFQQRLIGPDVPMSAQKGTMIDQMASITLAQFFSEPGLWIGLAIAAIFLAGAVRLRRYRGPI